MSSLYQVLLSQHQRQLMPMVCAEPTIAQLHRYFEDVVLENNLAALVIESLPSRPERTARSLERLREIGGAAAYAFYFVAPEDTLGAPPPTADRPGRRAPVLMRRDSQGEWDEHFVLIADARFSALLVSLRRVEKEGGGAAPDEAQVVWTFEPDVVYTALEYLMARVSAERFPQAEEFSTAVRACMPKATSLQLTVAVTTKLARLLQEQAAREVALNRIASAIRGSLELSLILQTAVEEVGRALGAQVTALRVAGDSAESLTTNYFFRDREPDEGALREVSNDLETYYARLAGRFKDGEAVAHGPALEGQGARPHVAVPLVYQQELTGVLLVSTDDPARLWQESEVLLLRTVADQVAVAANHARLFAQVREQALTDGLTGCLNRRSFEVQLGRDLLLATRMRQPVSLVMLDIDHFKGINDTHGHDAGDDALRFLAGVLREELRGVDTAARYGGEEFAVILPQAHPSGALIVAERLRCRLEDTVAPAVGRLTASFGIASFPAHASSPAQLIRLADQALYLAKRQGRNRVCLPPDASPTSPAEPTEPAI